MLTNVKTIPLKYILYFDFFTECCILIPLRQIMISLPNYQCRKYSVIYIDQKGIKHSVELYAYSAEQARQDVIDLVPYVFSNPESIKGITTHSK